MPERRVTVGSASGLHARPAAMFTRAAAESGVALTIAKPGGVAVDAASILAVMSLGVSQGEDVVIASGADGADDVLDRLAGLLASDLDAQAAS